MLKQNSKTLKMLLFGFLLVSTVLAEEHHFRIKICIQDGKVTLLEKHNNNETLPCGCNDLGSTYWQADLFLGAKEITGFGAKWYGLHDHKFFKIHFDGNKIRTITSEMLNDLPPTVEKASLDYNKIEILRKGKIDNKYLTTLSFSNNRIYKIDRGALMKMPRLYSLDLEHNSLINTEFAASLPPHLEELQLNNNDITVISARSFVNLVYLRNLTLGYNKITVIKEHSFEGLRNLRYLSLAHNPISEVRSGAFSMLINLRYLSLCGITTTAVFPQGELKSHEKIILLDCS